MQKITLSALLLAALTACAGADPEAGDEASPLALEDTPRVVSSDRRPAPLPAQCGGLQEAASTVLEHYQRCSRDSDCSVEFVQATCMTNFLCPVALRRDADLGRLKREAGALSFAYQQACTTACPVADCAAPTRIYCDAQTKRCASSFGRGQ